MQVTLATAHSESSSTITIPAHIPNLSPVGLSQQMISSGNANGEAVGRGAMEIIVPMHLQGKIGSKCCGCLCDYRRAVLWVNSTFIGISIFVLLSQSSAQTLVINSYDDDALATQVSDMVKEYYSYRSIPLGVALGTCVSSYVGVIYFQPWLVGLHILGLTADYITFCFLVLNFYRDMQTTLEEEIGEQPEPPLGSLLLNGGLTLLFLYPQIGFVLECQMGVFTKETFPREDYSICCNPKHHNVPPQRLLQLPQGAGGSSLHSPIQ